MDFEAIDALDKSESGEWMTVRLPSGAEMDAQIKLAGQDSQTYQKARDRALARMRKTDPTVEQLRAARMALCVACTIELRNVKMGSEAITPDNVDKFYKKFPWVLEQVDEFIHTRNAFLDEEALGKSSSGVNGASA